MSPHKRIAVQMDIDQAYRWHTDIFAGIHDFARQQPDWDLTVDEWADHIIPAGHGKPCPYDGYIGRIPAQGVRRARKLGLPCVNVWFNCPIKDVPGVYLDYAEGGRFKAEHLLSRGFRNFGVLYHKSQKHSVIEGEAFEAIVREAGCHQFVKLVEGGREDALEDPQYDPDRNYKDWQKRTQGFAGWLDHMQLPVALYIHQSSIARVIMEICRDRKWRVPEDVAIVAGANEITLCERPEPGITSLEWPYQQVGFEAARLLNRLISEKGKGLASKSHNRAGNVILLPPVGIVARRTTDFHAVDDPVLRRVLRYMDANLHRPISIDMLANAAQISRRTLTQHFRAQLGRTIAAEVQRLRIERVKRELTTSEQPIKQIARKVGFGSTRTLNDAFRSEVGCTPGDYRRQWTLKERG